MEYLELGGIVFGILVFIILVGVLFGAIAYHGPYRGGDWY
jgi:hypothetical protein